MLPAFAPTRVYVKNGAGSSNSAQVLVVRLDQPATDTVGWLKERLTERLMLRPGRSIVLSSWGRELADDNAPLSQCRLQTNAMIDLRLVLCMPDPSRGLQRVRITSTALKTRQLAVDERTTVEELKLRLEAVLLKGEHEWYDLEGQVTRVRGATLLAVAAVAADERAGTASLRQGEEVIGLSTGDGKKGGYTVRRAATGKAVVVTESNLALLELPPARQTLLFRGRRLGDAEVLLAAGVQHDDELALEFESPVMPAPLALLRAPAPPKKEKGAKGAKEGKGGGGKKKKK